MTTKHTISQLRITTSFILHHHRRKEDGRRQLKAHNRINRNGKQMARFDVLISVGEQPAYLGDHELQKGIVKLQVPNSLKLNALILAVKTEIDSMVKEQLKQSGHVKEDEIRAHIKKYCRTFEQRYTIEQANYALAPTVAPLFKSFQEFAIDQKVIDDIDENIKDETGQKVTFEDLEDAILEKQNGLEKQRRLERLKTMPTEERYKAGLFDRNNIFELFASIYYLDITNKFYTKIVIRLFEYRERIKPREHVKYLNATWAIDFFRYLHENGYYSLNGKTFDPFSYDSGMFLRDKPRKKYEDQTFQKMIHMFKEVLTQLKKAKLVHAIDMDDLNFNLYRKGTVQKGTRIEHYLTKHEFDSMFNFKFAPSKLNQYQTIFNTLKSENKIKRISTDSYNVTIDKLNHYRNAFCCMVMFGGQRGFEEYNTSVLQKYKNNEYNVSFYQNKTTNVVMNPLNPYTIQILKHQNNEIIKITDYEEFRAYLKLIAHIVGLDRKIQEKTNSNKFTTVQELLNPYMARKTFATVMLEAFNSTDDEIALFTGHTQRNKSELSTSYVHRSSIENKKKIIGKLKIGK